MHGGKAPQLWAVGEFRAVLDYLGEDVGTLDRLLAKLIANRLTFGWQARSGRWNQFSVPKLFTVEECLKLPRPDVSWMKEPPVMEDMLAWTGRVKAKGVTS